jgi:phosphoserine phosphatase
LPYNSELLRWLQGQRRAGRALWLATGADESLANRVAVHLGIFDGVLASDGQTNLTSSRKLAMLESKFGHGLSSQTASSTSRPSAFDYVGNSTADLPLLTSARQAMLANPTPGLRAAVRMRRIPVARTFIDPLSPVGQEPAAAVAAAALAQPAARPCGQGDRRVFLLQLHGFGQLPLQRHARHR